MDTFTRPITRVRLAESGGISVLSQDSLIKTSDSADDNTEVCLPEGPYRIVMHCRSTGRDTMKNETTIPKQ